MAHEETAVAIDASVAGSGTATAWSVLPNLLLEN